MYTYVHSRYYEHVRTFLNKNCWGCSSTFLEVSTFSYMAVVFNSKTATYSILTEMCCGCYQTDKIATPQNNSKKEVLMNHINVDQNKLRDNHCN